jgi:predicted nuclease of predicted toxin-antitoxin system
LPLRILADESVDYRIVKNLRKSEYEVVSVLEKYQGFSDKDVLEVAKSKEALLLTEDKDFGEWIFAHKEKGVGVVLLRYKSNELKQITDSLINLLSKYSESLIQKFAVIKGSKIRIRELP